MPAIVFLVSIALFLFWILALKDVVFMRDEDFEGKNDKLIWFIIVFFGNILGALAFVVWNASSGRRVEDRRYREAYRKAFPKKTD